MRTLDCRPCRPGRARWKCEDVNAAADLGMPEATGRGTHPDRKGRIQAEAVAPATVPV